MDHRRERRLESRDAGPKWLDADHLARPHLPERCRGRQSRLSGAVDKTKGEVLWKKPLGAGNVKMRKQNMSSPSPVTDGRSVYVMTGTGILKGFDFNGKELWTRDIQKDYGTVWIAMGLRFFAAAV